MQHLLPGEAAVHNHDAGAGLLQALVGGGEVGKRAQNVARRANAVRNFNCLIEGCINCRFLGSSARFTLLFGDGFGNIP